jgi:hypothetical protein
MPKFRKNPVVIEAVQWHGANVAEIELFTEGKAAGLKDGEGKIDRFLIPTLEGDHLCSLGDWIIRGVVGEFYPCKDNIFRKTYDPVEEL